MEEVSTAEALRERLADWRHEGDHIALVPTMGSLHEGHLSLVEIAREHAERVVVSVFVNPKQFADGEDFGEYPRTLERDKRRLKRVNADLLFVPEVETIYPFGIERATSVTVPSLTDELCGAFRPGHFDGLTTVISRLFGLVQPDVAVFGQKDYQQQLVIQRMTQDLSWPIQIICGETQREEDGLALSARNQFLTDEERAVAPKLHETLEEIGKGLETGQRNYAEIESTAFEKLKNLGFRPEYVSIRRAENLDAPDRDCDELVVLISAYLGKARLIDNLVVHI